MSSQPRPYIVMEGAPAWACEPLLAPWMTDRRVIRAARHVLEAVQASIAAGKCPGMSVALAERIGEVIEMCGEVELRE